MALIYIAYLITGI